MSGFSFFNKGPGTSLLQGVNLFRAAAALYAIYQNPESALENGPVAAISVFNAFALRDDADFLEGLLAFGLNHVRIGAIYSNVINGRTSASLATVAVEALFLIYSGFHTLIVHSAGDSQNPGSDNVNELAMG